MSFLNVIIIQMMIGNCLQSLTSHFAGELLMS